jgi:hypothetical protein
MTPAERPQDRARRPRAYHQSGRYTLTRRLPGVLERVADQTLPDTALTPLEAAARAWRRDVLTDLGGDVPATRLALVDAAVGSWIILTSVDRYLFALAAQDGLVNKRSRRVFAIVADRQRVADSLKGQLLAIGLERRAKPVPTLEQYLAEKYGHDGHESASQNAATPPESTTSDEARAKVTDSDVAGQSATERPEGARRRTPVTEGEGP